MIDYNLLYIGELLDSITIDYPNHFSNKQEKLKLRNSKYYLDSISDKVYRSWSSSKIQIYIDTLSVITKPIDSYNSQDIFYEAYPVYLQNLNLDTVTIGYGNNLPLIIEAKDSLSLWKAIESKWFYTCGNGVGSLILPPNEVALTSAFIYGGDYRTKLRLKMGNNYSEVFEGNINYQQFSE